MVNSGLIESALEIYAQSVSNTLPTIMSQARSDLAGHLDGDFSPSDWDTILGEAHRRWQTHREKLDDESAWRQVVREFHQERQWGLLPNYRAPRPERVRKKSLGVSFILLAGQAFIFSIMAVVWLGQIHTSSDEAVDGWIFYFAVSVVVANFGFFLWRHRKHAD